MFGRPSFRLLPHTADLAAELAAADEAGLAQAAVDLVRDVLVADSPVAARDERQIAAEGDEPAERFFRFVRELLYLFDAERFLPATARGTGPWTVAGEPFDPRRHVAERAVKALTRHGYRYERHADGLRVRLVLDL